MTEVSEAKARLRDRLVNGDLIDAVYRDPIDNDVQTVLDALDELENSYVPHLPAETDTWLRDSQDITLDHPLPPMSEVKFYYGPGKGQYLTARITDEGLRVWSSHGGLGLAPVSTNVILITGSIK